MFVKTGPATNGELYLPPHQPQYSTFLPSNGMLSQLSVSDAPLSRPSMNPLDQLSLRISPMSNNSRSPTAQETKIHSTVDQSTSENSDDEDIDVVKSAFAPIKQASLLLQEIQHPDSTVQDKELKRNELKAPSSRSISVRNLTAPKSPNTKLIHSAPTISATKTVWRPY